jgi:hypothetical protein
MKFRRKLVIAIATAGAAIGAGTGAAFAAWSLTGSGNGGAAATVAQGVTLTATIPTGAAATLWPGSPTPSSVYFTASNPNPYSVVITNITWGTPVSLNTTSCPSSNISVDTNAPKTGLSIVIPPNPQTGGFSVPNVLDLAHSAPDGCQGVGFDVPMTISGTQQ